MRSLGTIRARVDRLASAYPPSWEPLIVHWVHRHTRCPACGADLEGHAEAQALAAARADRARAERQVFYWAEEPATCPRCGARLP